MPENSPTCSTPSSTRTTEVEDRPPVVVESEGRFSRESLDTALTEICERLGLEASGATLLRFANNAVFRLAGDQAVVRIVGSRGLRHRVEKVVRIAAWFAEHDIPTVRLLAD